MATEAKKVVNHPLDPLLPDEIETAGELLRDSPEFTDNARMVKIELNEPSKEVLNEYRKNGDQIEREAFAVIRDSPERKTYEAVVSLEHEEIKQVEHIAGAQPSIAIQ